jgi:hypothetical protein
MLRSIPACGAALLLVAITPLHAQSIARAARSSSPVLALSIDLAEQRPGLDIARPVSIDEPTSISLILVNAVPSARYTVTISVDETSVGAVSLTKPPALALPSGAAVHMLYGTLLAQLDSAHDESSVGEVTRQTRRDVGRVYESGGEFMLDSLDARTVHRLESIATLHPGERLQVTVARWTDEGKESARWLTTFSTAPAGEWQIGLGFALPYALGNLEHYSVRRDGDGVCRVRATASDDRISLVPALYFDWIARDDRFDAWTLSVSGGVGFDMQNPVLLLGGALSFHQNITLMVGAAAHRVPWLDPEYAVGDVVDERLASEDLLTLRYAIDPFVGVGFRLLGSALMK